MSKISLTVTIVVIEMIFGGCLQDSVMTVVELIKFLGNWKIDKIPYFSWHICKATNATAQDLFVPHCFGLRAEFSC